MKVSQKLGELLEMCAEGDREVWDPDWLDYDADLEQRLSFVHEILNSGLVYLLKVDYAERMVVTMILNPIAASAIVRSVETSRIKSERPRSITYYMILTPDGGEALKEYRASQKSTSIRHSSKQSW